MIGNMDKDISKIDKAHIFISTGMKIIRGLLVKPFLKSSNGFLFVGMNVSILNKRHISVGKNVKFEKNSEIHGLSTDGVILGDNVTIGHTTMIRPSSYYGTGKLGVGVKIGNNSSIGPYGYVGCSGKIIIGNNVMFGPRVSLFAENHNFSKADVDIKYQGINRKGITIEDDCWIGSGVIILDGVTIAKGSVIAAGTLINKDILESSVVIDKRNKVSKQR